MIIDVRDKEIRAAKRDKEMLAFSEEILVTKSDLDEKTAQVCVCARLNLHPKP